MVVDVSSKPVTICNPINIGYRFSQRDKAKTCYREAADPSMVLFSGDNDFYLFPSVSGGYWRSSDLVSWTFIASAVLPTEDYAPDVRILSDGYIYFTASRHPPDHCPIFRSKTPDNGDSWELVSKPMPYWDPNMYEDNDGRVYVYHGCTNKRPMYGLELDRTTMLPIEAVEKQVPVIYGNAKENGWERLAENNEGMDAPYVEGAWMDKYKGKYYLQYAAPSTLINVYNDGVYESDTSPLGPFKLAAHNPFSFKPGGFMTGAGHGSTFQDHYGNYWHTSTMRITVHHHFERRIGIWPAGFDSDGVLFCNTRFGDYPMKMPVAGWTDPWTEPFSGWMLLSFQKPVTCSSEAEGGVAESEGERAWWEPAVCPKHTGSLAVNENSRDWWAAAKGDSAPELIVDLEGPCTVEAIQINFAEVDCNQYEREGDMLYHQYVLDVSNDMSSWETVCDKSTNTSLDVPHDYIPVSHESAAVQFVRVRIAHMSGGGRAAVSGLRVFGRGAGAAPDVPSGLVAERNADDRCVVQVSWAESKGADGYNVRWGITEEKLYSSWMVMGSTSLTMRCLQASQDYSLTVEAFNACGVSPTCAHVSI